MTRPGESFEESEVAEAYLHRPDYASGVYRSLLEINPAHGSLLDLGCGTGKIARRLSADFQSVTALDPSSEMLRVAASQDAGDAGRIKWIHGLAEEAEFEGAPFDLVVAAASIHWMDHAVVFPKLLRAVSPGHVFAVVDGDGPRDPPWQADWDSFLADWIHELKGEPYEPHDPDGAFLKRMNSYRRWLNISGEVTELSEPVHQSIDSFIACQHSRDTFVPSRLGARLDHFDQELRTLLQPYVNEGMLTYSVQSRLVWGTIRDDPSD